MSVVCAKVYKDKICVAADSIMTRGASKIKGNRFSKLTKINNIIVGSCGTAQEMSFMHHYLETHKPKDSSSKSILDFIVEFAKWKRDYGDSNIVENDYIIVFDGKCFCINSMFVDEVDQYCAIGAGEDFAYAALYLGHTPREAVKVAAELSCYVAEPIIEEELPR